MAIYGTNFIYDGIPSERYGLIIASFDGGGKAETNNPDINIIEQKVRGNPVPYFYGTEYNSVLEFPLTIVSTKELDIYDQRAIKKWLIGRNEYKWLQIDQPNYEGLWFRCILKNSKDIDIGKINYGLNFTVRCDSPFAWSDECVKQYSITTANQSVLFDNHSDIDDYLYPILEIELAPTTTSFSIINETDNNREFKFTNLQGGEKLIIDNQRQIITSSTNELRLDNFNLKWFRLLSGYNKLKINGNATVKIKCRFPRKVGG